MLWKELEIGLDLEDCGAAFRCIDGLSTIAAMLNFIHGASVYCTEECLEEVLAHVRSDRNEVGGLLLGRVFRVDAGRETAPGTIAVLTAAVGSMESFNSPVSLEMGTEIWLRAARAGSSRDIVAGWYHSHPGLGAFFSETDRRTHRAFFSHDFSVGWVIDPVRDEQKMFVGPEANEYSQPLMVVGDGLALA